MSQDNPHQSPRFTAWQLVHNGGMIAADEFLAALAEPSVAEAKDVRSQMLVRDGLEALRTVWDEQTLQTRLSRFGTAPQLKQLRHAFPGERGFWMLKERIVEPLDPKAVMEMLRELGLRVSKPASVTIGGSIALILEKILVRQTDDVVVDELPKAIRTDYQLLDELTTRYKLKLAHFQSHYLPDGWKDRTKSLGKFGRLDVAVVDHLDILAGKLFSRRTKDLDDLREALPRIDREAFRNRLASSTRGYRDDEHSSSNGKKNWYILTGEEHLPPQTQD